MPPQWQTSFRLDHTQPRTHSCLDTPPGSYTLLTEPTERERQRETERDRERQREKEREEERQRKKKTRKREEREREEVSDS